MAFLLEFDSYTQNSDRWKSPVMLVAGRTNGPKKVAIPIDASFRSDLFAQPGARFGNYQQFEKCGNMNMWLSQITGQ